MKHILFFLFLLCLNFAARSQYPITQNLGSSSTLVQVPATGGLRAAFVNRSFADTATANLHYIAAYPFAQIATTGDGNLWMRNASATGWSLLGGGLSPSGTFWNVGGNLFPVTATTRNMGTLAPYGGAIGLMTNSVVRLIINDTGLFKNQSATDSVLVRNTSGEIGIYPRSAFTPTWQQTLTAGSTLTGNNTIAGGKYSFTWSNMGQIESTAENVGGDASSILLYPTSIYLITDPASTGIGRLAMEDTTVTLGASSGSSILDYIQVTPTTLTINPSTSNDVFAIKNIPAGASTDSVLVRTASTGQVKYRNASAFGGTYTFTNGLTESGGTVKLGGTLVEPTTIAGGGQNFTINNSAQLQLSAELGGNVDIGASGRSQIIIGDNITVSPHEGGLIIDTLNHTLSTTGKKIMLRDTAGGLVQNIDPALLTVSGVTAGSQGQIYQTSNGAAAWKYDTTTLVTFNAGANFAADTAAFTDSTIYGSFKLMGNDTFYVTGVSAVMYSNNGVTDTLGIQITYNDTINVVGSNVFAATYAIANETTGQDADGDDFTGSTSVPIPPGNWVWLKSPTVVAGRKPYHLSVSIIGYKKRVN